MSKNDLNTLFLLLFAFVAAILALTWSWARRDDGSQGRGMGGGWRGGVGGVGGGVGDGWRGGMGGGMGGGWRGILALAALALIARVAFATLIDGFPTDMNCFRGWSSEAASNLTRIYASGGFQDYPPGYMYVLFAIGKAGRLFGIGETERLYTLLIKLPPILADVASGVLLYWLPALAPSSKAAGADGCSAGSVAGGGGANNNNGNAVGDAHLGVPFTSAGSVAFSVGGRTRLAIAALYLFNPAVFFDSAIWGQIDSFLALAVFAAILCHSLRRHWLAGALFAAAILIKPQGFVFLPVLFASLAVGLLARRDWAAVFKTAGGAGGALAAIALPFWVNMGLPWLPNLYLDTLGGYRFATVNAFNLYALLGANWTADSEKLLGLSYAAWGTAAMAAFAALACICVLGCALAPRRSARLAMKPRLERAGPGSARPHAACALMLISALLLVGVVTFGHRMHERYCFPAILLLLGAAQLAADAHAKRAADAADGAFGAGGAILAGAAALTFTGYVNMLLVFSAYFTDEITSFYETRWIYIISAMNVATAIALWAYMVRRVDIRRLPGAAIRAAKGAGKGSGKGVSRGAAKRAGKSVSRGAAKRAGKSVSRGAAKRVAGKGLVAIALAAALLWVLNTASAANAADAANAVNADPGYADSAGFGEAGYNGSGAGGVRAAGFERERENGDGVRAAGFERERESGGGVRVAGFERERESGAAAAAEVANPGFEDGLDGWDIYDYRAQYEGQEGISTVSIDYETSYSGSASLKISSSWINDVRVYQAVGVEEDSLYKVSCRAKVEGVADGLGAAASMIGLLPSSEGLTGTGGGFVEIAYYGATGPGQRTLDVAFGLGGYGDESMGTAWIDDVKVERVDAAPAGETVHKLYYDGESDDEDEYEGEGEGEGEGEADGGGGYDGEGDADGGGGYDGEGDAVDEDGSTLREGATPASLQALAMLLVVSLLALLFRAIVFTPPRASPAADTGLLPDPAADEAMPAGDGMCQRDGIGHRPDAGGRRQPPLRKPFAVSVARAAAAHAAAHADALIMSAMTLAYLAVALARLGGHAAPQTYWKPIEPTDSVVIGFGGERSVSRILYNCNTTQHSEEDSYFDVYADGGGGGGITDADAGGDGGGATDGFGAYGFVCYLDDKAFFEWKSVNVDVRATRIRLDASVPGMALNEIAFLDPDGAVIPASIVYEDTVAAPSAFGVPQNLIDEPDTVPGRPDYMNSTYFDEVYFPRTAYESIHKLPIYETTHPPLGKLVIALGVMVFGMNPFGWRVMGVLAGAAMLPAMYMFGKKLFGGSRAWASCAAFLMMFDFMHFVQSRLATIDVFASLAIIMMYCFMMESMARGIDGGACGGAQPGGVEPGCAGDSGYMEPSLASQHSLRHALAPLALCGLAFGLGAATKWIALFAAGGIAFVFVAARVGEFRAVKRRSEAAPQAAPLNAPQAAPQAVTQAAPLNAPQAAPQWLRASRRRHARRLAAVLAACVVFFVLVPGTIYLLSYIPYTQAPGATRSVWGAMADNQGDMLSYHTALTDTHAFESPWWSWPLMVKPIWIYAGSGLPEGIKASISSFGNPLIWWVGIPCLVFAAYQAVRRRDGRMAVVVVGFLFQYVPWMFVARATFIYHYFSALPFVILAIVYTLKRLVDGRLLPRAAVAAYLAAAAALFVVYYPVLSGTPSAAAYIDSLKLFSSWYW